MNILYSNKYKKAKGHEQEIQRTNILKCVNNVIIFPELISDWLPVVGMVKCVDEKALLQSKMAQI